MFNSAVKKTDPVEIFQTIRASLQPYATMGYTVHQNSETEYALYSEKNIQEQDEKVTERFFTGILIEDGHVKVMWNTTDFEPSKQQLTHFYDDRSGFILSALDDDQLKEISTMVEIIHTHFKENEWI